MNPKNQPDYQEFKNSEFHRQNYVKDVSQWVKDLPKTWSQSHHEGKVWWLFNHGHIDKYEKDWLLGKITHLEKKAGQERSGGWDILKLIKWGIIAWLLLQLFGNQ